MTWVETVSPSFRARHDSASEADAERVLRSLELVREHLTELFPHTVSELTVVLHRSPASLSLSNPLLPVRRLAAAPGSRRYVAGWAGREVLHVLSPSTLAQRASNVTGSREMLNLTAAALYARRVIERNNPDLPRRALSPRRLRVELHWTWLLEGAARFFAGQTAHARPAIARRLREHRRPSFPPDPRDAVLLGGTVIDLLVREEGEQAAARLAGRLHPQGSLAALKKAFRGRAVVHTEGAWRSHLARLAGEI